MHSATKPTLLTIGVEGVHPSSDVLDIYTATTLREAVATIRLIGFDLLVVGLQNPRLDVWQLMQRILTAWPHQRWILASRRVTMADELQARSLGALLVLDEVPNEHWFADFAASLRRRDASRPVPAAGASRALHHGPAVSIAMT